MSWRKKLGLRYYVIHITNTNVFLNIFSDFEEAKKDFESPYAMPQLTLLCSYLPEDILPDGSYITVLEEKKEYTHG